MKSFRRIIFSSFLVILLSISFGASLAITDAATATFIGSVDSRYKYQPDSDRRLSTSFLLREYDKTCWSRSVSFDGMQGTLSAAKWYRVSYVNNTTTAYISGTLESYV